MIRRLLALLAFACLLPAAHAQGTDKWVEGHHYYAINPQLRTSVPAGKVEVTEVFSYGCPHCSNFRPVIKQLKASLPSTAQLVFVPASFNPGESWPLFQRAFCTAQILGVADKGHDAMFDAIWKSGELAVVDTNTGRLKSPAPTIDDVASVYNKATGVAADKFIEVSKSFAVSVKMKEDDTFVMHALVDSTPTIIVNGKYRVTMESAGSADQMLQVIRYLVQKESGH